jgi:hypothetical protein
MKPAVVTSRWVSRVPGFARALRRSMMLIDPSGSGS